MEIVKSPYDTVIIPSWLKRRRTGEGGGGGERGKKPLADESTDAFPRFFVETCAGRGKRVEKFSRSEWGGGQKTAPRYKILPRSSNRYSVAILFHARGEFDYPGSEVAIFSLISFLSL